MDNASIKKLESDLWESADLLRAGSKLTSNQYCMEFLNLSADGLIQLFVSVYEDTEREPWECVEDFLSEHIVDEKLEYIQMFHLSRRLNGTDLKANSNLEKLLLGSSPLSNFFRKYKITFESGEGHINLYYNGIL